ncbi:MAG: GTP 3',8-cyclase MoaA [Aigarchaeota archaeon]|nr:GTP 3',8-cyclase MoaA [Candidatus Calditenuaceae archaeon]
MENLVDGFGRVARKLRLSVTDRCNFRCSFCMPREPVWLPSDELLSFEEILRVVRIFASMGVSRVRLTGGEPLVRAGVERLVKMIAAVEGVEGVSMTTNGFHLSTYAERLAEAGLKSVTVSLHSLKPEKFDEIVGVRGVFNRVMAGVAAARKSGLAVKINVVVVKGCNDDELFDFAELARETGMTVRFIEFMPFDGERSWSIERVVNASKIIEVLSERYQLYPKERESGSTARYYGFKDTQTGEIGVISSVSEPFCWDCDRVRVKADGKLVPCLFSRDEYDLKPLLRSGATDEEVIRFVRLAFMKKFRGVETLLRSNGMLEHVRPMHTIGG